MHSLDCGAPTRQSLIDETDGGEEIFLMTTVRKQRVGIAWCSTISLVIRFCEIGDSAPFSQTERTLRAIEPNLILTPANAIDEFRAMLTRVASQAVRDMHRSEVQQIEAFPAERLAAVSGGLGDCLELADGGGPLVLLAADDVAPQRIEETIRWWQNPVDALARHQLSVDVSGSSSPDRRAPLDDQGPVGQTCLGALLSFLAMRCDVDIHTVRAEPFYMEQLAISPMSLLRELRVLPAKVSAPRSGARVHQHGLTLYQIISSFGASAPGQRKIREILTQPICDPARIRERLEVVQALTGALASIDMILFRKLLKAVHHPQNLWRRLVSGAATAEDWAALHGCNVAVAGLFNGFSDLVQIVLPVWRERSAFLQENAQELTPVLDPEWYTSVATRIGACIDMSGSKSGWNPAVKTGFDENLDNMRLALESLDSFLESVAQSEKSRYFGSSATERSICVQFHPRLGYVMKISRSDAAQMESDASLEHALDTDTDAYVKNDRTRQLDEELGDLPGAINDLEKSIIRDLEAAVIPTIPVLSRTCDLLAEIDCWLSFALSAMRYEWTCPQVLGAESACHIDVIDARHPIQELTVDSFVPNSLSVRRGDVCVVTGPNASGKSVLLRQVALIVHMAQVGSYVPARSARIGVTDRIFARVKSFDSTGRETSTFMNDCIQMAQTLRYATSRSLAIVDEFGKGTSDEDGRALAAAVLSELATNVTGQMTVLFATHFHEVTGTLYAQAHANSRLRFFKLEVLVQENRQTGDAPDQNDDVVLTALYKLSEGAPCLDSYALACARANGMPDAILSRARKIRRFLQARALPPEASLESAATLQLPIRDACPVRRYVRLQHIVRQVGIVASTAAAGSPNQAHATSPRVLHAVQQLLQDVSTGRIWACSESRPGNV